MPSQYSKEDAAKDTNVSVKEVSAAHHQARDDSGVRTNSGGDRPTLANKAEAAEIGRSFGLNANVNMPRK